MKEEKRVALHCRWLNANPDSSAYGLCGFGQETRPLWDCFLICNSTYLIGLVVDLNYGKHLAWQPMVTASTKTLKQEGAVICTTVRQSEWCHQRKGGRNLRGLGCRVLGPWWGWELSPEPRKSWNQGGFIIKAALLLRSPWLLLLLSLISIYSWETETWTGKDWAKVLWNHRA